MARKFLYVVVGLIMLALAASLAYRMFPIQLFRMTMVPSVAFEDAPALPQGAYAKADRWLARPDKPGNPALWTPAGHAAAANPPAALFFIHPTSYMDRGHWNAPADSREAASYAEIFVRQQASAFNQVAAIWAPRYRQATFGAFLTNKPEAEKALDLAYRDVLVAFDAFLEQAGDRPILLAGHSQGALHLTRLLKDRIAGTPLQKRVVAAYVIGWPVSRTVDLPALGLHECAGPEDTGCILSWQSFAEPADPSLILDTFDAEPGFTGAPRKGTPMICTNPLTGGPGGNAPASANLGTLIASADQRSGTLLPGKVPARCEGRGLLLVGTPPDVGPFVLPGNNYHVFDYVLFWANVRQDAARRLAAFGKRAG